MTSLKFEQFRRSPTQTEYKTLFPCPDCKKKRWIRRIAFKESYFTGRCRSCSSKRNGEKSLFKNPLTNPNYNGGRTTRSGGYIALRVELDSAYFCMADSNKYVPEHRLVMAKHMGRPLEKYEVVHHKNGITNDNRIINLELTTPQLNNAYSRASIKCPKCEHKFNL